MKRLGLDGGRLKWSHSDPGTDYTDKQLREVANRLKDLYEEAANDLYMKQQSFIHAHAARVQKYLAKVEAGEMTRTDFEAWMQGQIFQGEQWAQKREQIARQMVDIDQQAQQIVNEGKLSVFAENANYMGWKLEKGAGANLGFGVYDRATVSRLIKEQPNLLPMPKIDKGKDYRWYNGIVNRAVTQGIMQGEDLEDIVFRLALETGEKSLSAMRRNARTAYTYAQNAGRLEGMRQARDKLGINLKKRWIAFLDSKTRDAHAELDGQVADIDEPFDSMLGPIMCPGDPEAEPANVYNCRCTLEDYYPEYPDSGDRIDEDGENVGDMSYKEWREMKANSENKTFTGVSKSGIMEAGALNGYSKRAEEHAERYYESVRHMKTDTNRIAENTGWSIEDIQKVKEHVFFNTHILDGRIGRFDSSYFIAQSWQRLIQGKGEIREEDIVLLNHELMELRLEEQGMTYEQAHAEAEKLFNYAKYLPDPEE